MRIFSRYLALALCVAVIGSVADAKPSHGHHEASKKKHRVVEQDSASDETVDDADEIPRASRSRKSARLKRKAREAETETERVAFATPDAGDVFDIRDEDLVDAPAKVRKQAVLREKKDWSIALGPYLWASSVDANVSLGSASVATGVDFFDMQKHAKYGAELLAEGRLGRFSISGDLMYGVVGVNGGRDVGPLMVTVDGRASSLLVDSFAGYRMAGSEESLLAFEVRAGLRYQRTAVSGTVDVEGNEVAPPETVDAAGDALAGARVVVRPSSRFYVSAAGDLGVYGMSNTTWSASADASVRITSHVLLSLGWRTLKMDRAQVSMTMHGPRAALQLTF